MMEAVAPNPDVTFTQVPASEPPTQGEVVHATPRVRRTFTDAEKEAIVAEAAAAKGNKSGGGVRGVLAAHGITFPQLARWRRDLKRGEKDSRVPARFRVRRARGARAPANLTGVKYATPPLESDITSELERMAEDVCRRTLKRVLARLCGEEMQA